MSFGSRLGLPRWLLVMSAVLCVSFLLGGCSKPDAKPIPTGPPTAASPVFASDEEALAAAEAGYDLYQDAWNAVAMEGGVDPMPMTAVVRPENLRRTLDGLLRFSAAGLRTSGEVIIASTKLQSYRDIERDVAVIVLHACLDFSNSRVIDAEGDDVTPAGRESMVPSVVRLVSSDADPRILQFGGDEVWDGDDFCE